MENSLMKMRPELAKEWSEKNLPLTPDDVPCGSNKLYWWKGSCGHEWQTSAKARSHGEKCPICANMRIISGINDLSTLKPKLADEWSDKNLPLTPNAVGIGSHKKVWWHGKCGHEWDAPIRNRVKGAGCPYCSHNKVLAGFNDLETLYPNVAREWSDKNFPLLPSQVTAYANKKVWWKCNEGHEWFTLISTRSYGSKCPYCSGIKLLKGYNDFKTQYPELAAEWSERNGNTGPYMVNARSTKNVWWRCSRCGNEWLMQVKTRASGGMCPVCAEREVKPGINDLATKYPNLLLEWDYKKNKIDPTKTIFKSYKRAWWICEFGHSWNAPISDRTMHDITCKECDAEFAASLPALLTLYYARKSSLKVIAMSDDVIGLPLDAYLPALNIAIDGQVRGPKIKAVKKSLCERNGIDYHEIAEKGPTDIANHIKSIFRSQYIFITSETEEDIKICKEHFYSLKRKTMARLPNQ